MKATVLGAGIAGLETEQQLRKAGFQVLLLQPRNFKGGSIVSPDVSSRAISNTLLGHVIIHPSLYHKSYYKQRLAQAGIDLGVPLNQFSEKIERVLSEPPVSYSQQKKNAKRRVYSPLTEYDQSILRLRGGPMTDPSRKALVDWLNPQFTPRVKGEWTLCDSGKVRLVIPTNMYDSSGGASYTRFPLRVPAHNNDFSKIIDTYAPENAQYGVSSIKIVKGVDTRYTVSYSVGGRRMHFDCDYIFHTLSTEALSSIDVADELLEGILHKPTSLGSGSARISLAQFEELRAFMLSGVQRRKKDTKDAIKAYFESKKDKYPNYVPDQEGDQVPFGNELAMKGYTGTTFTKDDFATNQSVKLPWATYVTTVDPFMHAKENKDCPDVRFLFIARRLASKGDGELPSGLYEKYNTDAFYIGSFFAAFRSIKRLVELKDQGRQNELHPGERFLLYMHEHGYLVRYQNHSSNTGADQTHFVSPNFDSMLDCDVPHKVGGIFLGPDATEFNEQDIKDVQTTLMPLIRRDYTSLSNDQLAKIQSTYTYYRALLSRYSRHNAISDLLQSKPNFFVLSSYLSCYPYEKDGVLHLVDNVPMFFSGHLQLAHCIVKRFLSSIC